MERVKTPASSSGLRPALGAFAACMLIACTGTPSALTQDSHAIRGGAKLYAAACAGCHGANAHGPGPIAPLIGAPVPDLTRIAARRSGTFPAEEIYRIVDGQADLSAHGPRHMPVWGYEFFGNDPDDEAAHRRATVKVDNLVLYLRSVQRAE